MNCSVEGCAEPGIYLAPNAGVLDFESGYVGGFVCELHYGEWATALADNGSVAAEPVE